MQIQDAYYHGIYHQVRRVVTAMSDDEIDRGLSAFEDGHSDWSDCFFARAFAGSFNCAHVGDPEATIAKHLKLVYADGRPNKIPVRIVYSMFDQISGSILRKPELYKLISDIRDDRREPGVVELLKGMKFDRAEKSSLSMFPKGGGNCVAKGTVNA